MANPAIEIERLTKDYPVGFWRKKMRRSLDHLSLQVEEGESFGFLGPNGAGKTTTMKLLMGLIFPTSGTARVRGRSINDVRMHREIGYMPEQPYFYDYLTARELLAYFARFFGFNAAERNERVARFLSLVGLAAAADVQLRKFSKGMLQRVGIAQAILHDPQVIFLDEPMSGLDPVGRREVRDILLDAHSFRRGNALRPRGRAARRQIARSWLAGGDRVHGSARHGNLVRSGQGTDAARKHRGAREKYRQSLPH
jgi:ABC-2 type transport system ATP-binding protein